MNLLKLVLIINLLKIILFHFIATYLRNLKRLIKINVANFLR